MALQNYKRTLLLSSVFILIPHKPTREWFYGNSETAHTLFNADLHCRYSICFAYHAVNSHFYYWNDMILMEITSNVLIKYRC